MPLNAQCGQITAPGSTGVQTYSLPANFDPKVLFVWMTYQTTNAKDAAGNAVLNFGMATYRSSTVQQHNIFTFTEHNNAVSNTVRGSWTSSILQGIGDGAAGTTTDYEVDFDSFVTGASSSFKLNWVDLPATASLLVNYLVLGGSAIADAQVGSFTMSTAAATQNITVATGFGVADLIMFSSHGWTDATGAFVQGDTRFSLGWGTNALRRTATYGAQGLAVATADVGVYTPNTGRNPGFEFVNNHLGYMFGSTIVTDAIFGLSSRGSWPLDGFQLSFSDQASFGFVNQGYCAIRFVEDAAAFVDSYDVETTAIPGGVLVPEDYTPKGVLITTCMHQAAGSGIIFSGSTVGGFQIGAADGTNEVSGGIFNTDAAADMTCARSFSNTRAIQTPGGEADVTFKGQRIDVDWTADPDTAKRSINFLTFAERTRVGPKPTAADFPVGPLRSAA